MEKIIHKANSRGHAFHGWLESYHSFSFASYRNPERMHFGVLRVLNDDRVAPGQGFGTHPHENMEIISIPLKGDLEHKDSMGNTTVIKSGDIQIMSAGTGVQHSEYNKNEDSEVEFLQIWIIPKVRNVSPRYDQIAINSFAKSNEFYQILSPNAEDQGVWIHQNAWFSMGDFERGNKTSYTLHDQDNGVYVFVLEGSIEIDGSQLNRRDAIGLWDTREFDVTALETAKVLLMEVPMSL
ncbi:MAG: pirin family protein [Flavobacteriaceae bacterium]